MIDSNSDCRCYQHANLEMMYSAGMSLLFRLLEFTFVSGNEIMRYDQWWQGLPYHYLTVALATFRAERVSDDRQQWRGFSPLDMSASKEEFNQRIRNTHSALLHSTYSITIAAWSYCLTRLKHAKVHWPSLPDCGPNRPISHITITWIPQVL